MLNTGILQHCGIMVNYQCNASCRHCLYSCSPARKPDFSGESRYVNAESAAEICRLLSRGGCRSVHIGGGEPFLNFDGLIMMVQTLNQSGINFAYIETNAFWAAKNQKEASEKLNYLMKEGVESLCISIDPFHAEYVPYGAPLALAELCEKTGMGYFLWKQEFLPSFLNLDPHKKHSRQEMEKTISKDYIYKTARNYGIHYGGRAVNIEREFGSLFPAENFTGDNSPCKNLLSTGHFHVDKDVYFIPPRCTGIRLPLEEAAFGIPENKYRAFEALYYGGIATLFKLGKEYGFTPNPSGYPSKCNLCFHIRHFLSEKDFIELDRNHYEEGLKR